MSADIQNLGNGYYFVSLVAITVAHGEEPILLNMTISAFGYDDKYFETHIAVHPSDLVEDTLDLEVVNQSFSTGEFNITFFVHSSTGFPIDAALIQAWWDGTDVSDDLQNLGNGIYYLVLEPITVEPGKPPILLNMTIYVSGYDEFYFETNIAVDPDTLQKGNGSPTGEFPWMIIIIILPISVGAIIGLISFWYWNRRKQTIQYNS